MAKAIETIVSAKDKRRFSLKAQAEDLAEARKALESAANISRGLWFTFMTLAAGVFITTGTVTHRDLFLETPVKLPLLNAELPLVAFFWVTPLMFILFHAYLLLNLTSLGVNVRHYFDLVDDTGLDAKSKNKLYLQLPNFMVVQMLRARREKYWTMMGYALHIVVALTVVVGPLVALLFLQVKFLPYHEHGVTWVQRAVITLDAAAIFYFWPEIVGKPASLLVWYVRMMLYSVVLFIFLFSFFVARFPGEAYYKNGPFESSGIAKWLFRGKVDDVEGKTESFFSDRLVLANEDFVDLDDDKLARADKTVAVRGRDLVGAYLARTDLRKADFTGADMTLADFSAARLQGAVFAKPATPPIRAAPDEATQKTAPGSQERGTNELKKKSGEEPDKQEPISSPKTLLVEANFNGACLNGANFEKADVRRATFRSANLDNATLQDARLQGAIFDRATLQNAKMNRAKLKGASFVRSDLSNATLTSAIFTGALLYRSQMQGANMDSATINAATFIGNSVQGISDARTNWSTILVHGVTEIDTSALEDEKSSCMAIGGTVAESDAAATKVPEAPRILKAIEIMAKGVNRLRDNATNDDKTRWRGRIDALEQAICGEPENSKEAKKEADPEGDIKMDREAGADVLHRILNGPNFLKYPDMHIGPFKRRIAYKILDHEECFQSEAFPPGLNDALKCWIYADAAEEKACRAKALGHAYFKDDLP